MKNSTQIVISVLILMILMATAFIYAISSQEKEEETTIGLIEQTELREVKTHTTKPSTKAWDCKIVIACTDKANPKGNNPPDKCWYEYMTLYGNERPYPMEEYGGYCNEIKH